MPTIKLVGIPTTFKGKNRMSNKTDACPHCKFIEEFLKESFNGVSITPEDKTALTHHYMYTELFVYLHGKVYCNFNRDKDQRKI